MIGVVCRSATRGAPPRSYLSLKIRPSRSNGRRRRHELGEILVRDRQMHSASTLGEGQWEPPGSGRGSLPRVACACPMVNRLHYAVSLSTSSTLVLLRLAARRRRRTGTMVTSCRSILREPCHGETANDVDLPGVRGIEPRLSRPMPRLRRVALDGRDDRAAALAASGRLPPAAGLLLLASAAG